MKSPNPNGSQISQNCPEYPGITPTSPSGEFWSRQWLKRSLQFEFYVDLYKLRETLEKEEDLRVTMTMNITVTKEVGPVRKENNPVTKPTMNKILGVDLRVRPNSPEGYKKVSSVKNEDSPFTNVRE